MLVRNFWRFLLVKPQGAWKNRRLKTETDSSQPKSEEEEKGDEKEEVASTSSEWEESGRMKIQDGRR